MPRILRQATQIVVRIGPAVAVADGFTPVTTLALSTADEAEALRAGTATLDISGATFAAVTGADGWYDLTLTTTATSTVGELVIVIQDDSLILPLYAVFQVIEEATYDRDYAAAATGNVTLAAVTHTGATIPTVTTTGTATAVTTVNGLAANVITAAAINTGAFTAAKFAAGAFDAVWTVAVRVLTAATNLTTALATPTNITAGTITTVTNLTNAPTAGDLTATMKASVNAEVDTALADIHLDHLLAVTYDPASKPGAADALLNELVESDAGVARYTANALEQAPTGGSAPTVGEIADAVWDEDLTGHVTADTAGEILGNVATGTPPTAAAIADAVWDEAQADHVSAGTFGEVATETAAILVDTAVIGAAGAGLTEAGGTGDHLTALASQTSVNDLPTTSELTTALAGADDATLAAIAALNNLSSAQAQTAAAAALTAYDGPTNAEMVARTLVAASYSTLTQAQVATEMSDALTVDVVADSVPADGSRPTIAQAVYLLTQFMLERSVTGTTMTVRKPDGSTSLITLTLDDATTPTSVTRSA